MDTPPLHVALWEPEIPPNTGNVARLCAATGTALHLIGRLGFPLHDRSLKPGRLRSLPPDRPAPAPDRPARLPPRRPVPEAGRPRLLARRPGPPARRPGSLRGR